MKELKEKNHLPEGWKFVKLNDISHINMGQSPNSNSYNYDNIGLPFFQGKAEFGELYPTIAKYCSDPIKTADKNDILISVRAPIGPTNLAPKECCIGRGLASIKPFGGISHLYILWYLRYIESSIINLGTGSVFKAISKNILENIFIPVPPIQEIDRITLRLEELFSGLNKSKEQLRTSLNQLGIYKQSVLKQAFEGKLTKEWRGNQNNLKTPQQIINDINTYQQGQYKKELEDFNNSDNKLKPKKPKKLTISIEAKTLAQLKLPNEWTYIALRDICTTVDRVILKERNADDKFIYLDIGGINNKKNIIETYKEYQWKDAPSRAQYIVKVHDILFSTVRTYLKKIAIIEEEKFNFQIASSGFAVIRTLEKFINPKYIFKYIVSDGFIQPLNILQSGSSYPAVRNSDVFDQFIPICSLEEQNVIFKELDRQFSIINHFEDTIEKNLLNIETLKQSLLQKTFAGDLLEQDPNDELVTLLLDRIKVEKEEYLIQEKENKNNSIKNKIMTEESKSILEILKENLEPISSKQLWLSSDKKDDIEEFYAELKKYIESGDIIELPKNGKESFLRIAEKS